MTSFNHLASPSLWSLDWWVATIATMERNLKHNLPLDDVTVEHEDLPRLKVDPMVTAWLKGEQHLLETVQTPNSFVRKLCFSAVNFPNSSNMTSNAAIVIAIVTITIDPSPDAPDPNVGKYSIHGEYGYSYNDHRPKWSPTMGGKPRSRLSRFWKKGSGTVAPCAFYKSCFYNFSQGQSSNVEVSFFMVFTGFCGFGMMVVFYFCTGRFSLPSVCLATDLRLQETWTLLPNPTQTPSHDVASSPTVNPIFKTVARLQARKSPPDFRINAGTVPGFSPRLCGWYLESHWAMPWIGGDLEHHHGYPLVNIPQKTRENQIMENHHV